MGTQEVDIDGAKVRFLEDGDEVVLRGFCRDREDGSRYLGFGECRGVILPAFESTT